ncbi:expressed unknown protein [Seminavis robusta]|uniref:Uncharacterized protein n=1 Tax=Seminavis robusta TaxID=568900 RepID=A0A9N8H2C3_9STRA|nr:expressed unknown protein [Seminavis robusta]|eukprot:Sro33_g021410.1 n/a (261) ;mRNA; f:70682-71589
MKSFRRTLIALLSLIGSAQSTRLAFRFDGMDHSGCKSSAYDVELGELHFQCDSGEDICRPGDSVVVEGWFNAHSPLPVDMTQRVKVCKYFGMMCTHVLEYSSDYTFKESWHLYSQYSNVSYPNPGLYGFERRFTWPDNTMSDFAWAGFPFSLTIDVQAEDTGNDWTHMRCHAPFTTVNYDTWREDGSTGSGFSPTFGQWSMVGLVGFGATAGWISRKKKRKPILTLDGPDFSGRDACATNFEMMGGGETETGGDPLAVRV